MYRQRKLVKLENFQPEQKAENEPWAAFCYSEYKYDYIYKMLNMYGFDMYIIGKDVYAFEDDKDDIISKYTNENILVCEINDSIGSIDIPCSITKDQYEEIKNWNGDQVTVNFKDSHIYFLVLKSFDSVYRENIDLALTPDGEMIRYDSMGLGTLTGVKLSDEQTELIRSYL